jgi:anti-anti-sigma factor
MAVWNSVARSSAQVREVTVMIEIRQVSDRAVILAPFGELAGPVAATLRRIIEDLGFDGLDIAIDLSRVPQVDAFGLGVLASSARQVRSAGNDFTVHRARPAVWRRMECSGLVSDTDGEGDRATCSDGYDPA